MKIIVGLETSKAKIYIEENIDDAATKINLEEKRIRVTEKLNKIIQDWYKGLE